MTKKTSTLAAAASNAAGKKAVEEQDKAEAPQRTRAPNGRQAADRQGTGGVMVGGIYAPIVRKTLKHIEADHSKTLRQLLGEAINDLCAKYGQPQPFRDEA